jgi:hypothetical protein
MFPSQSIKDILSSGGIRLEPPNDADVEGDDN